MYLSKTVTLSLEAVNIITGFQNRTKSNFSKTLDRIIKDWDNISLEIEKFQRKKIKQEADIQGENLQKAKVIK